MNQKNRKTIYLLTGAPGSGKSTFARINCCDNDVVVSRDKIRFSLIDNEKDYFKYENEVFDLFINEINLLLNSICVNNIWVDATHLTEKSRNKVLDKIELDKADIIVYNFLDGVEDCLQHNEQRNGLAKVPNSAIRRMSAQYEPATHNEKHIYKEIRNIRNGVRI